MVEREGCCCAGEGEKEAGLVSRNRVLATFLGEFDLTQSQEVMAGLSDEIDAAADDNSRGMEAEGDLNRFFDGAGGRGWDSRGFGGGEEIGYLGRSWRVDRGQDNVVEDWEKDLGHLTQGLIAQAGEDEALALPGLRNETWGNETWIGGLTCGKGCAESPGSSGVMSYVENEFGMIGEGESLQAAGPAGVCDALLDGGRSDGEVAVLSEFDR